MIHQFGITSKAQQQKNESYKAEISSEFTLNKINEHFSQLKPFAYQGSQTIDS